MFERERERELFIALGMGAKIRAIHCSVSFFINILRERERENYLLLLE